MPENYDIIFEKLDDLHSADAADANGADSEAVRKEIAEIAELRRIVLEITEPLPTYYTGT